MDYEKKSISGSGSFFISLATIIGGATLGLFGVALYLFSLIRGIITSSYQIRLKRKALGIVSLILNIVMLFAVIVIVWLLVNSNS